MKHHLGRTLALLAVLGVPGCPGVQPVSGADAAPSPDALAPDAEVVADSAVEICTDGLDNDGDGLTDMDDPDCYDFPCGGICYALDFLTPAMWGTVISEASDDLEPTTPCVQYDVVVQATSPLADSQVCVYVDDLNSPAVECVDPNLQNPITVPVSLCAGVHMLYARVEQGTEVCSQVNVGLKQLEVTVYENPTCDLTLPVNLSTDPANPTCWTAPLMDVQVTSSATTAQLCSGATGSATGGVIDFPGTPLGADGTLVLCALCSHPGIGTGETWSPDYYVIKDTVPPAVQILAPPSGSIFGAADCPFLVTVTDVEAGQTVCAHYQNQVPSANGCAVSTGPSDLIDLGVDCVGGANLIVEANTPDDCGNVGQDTILVTVDTGAPVLFIENPTHGQLFNKTTDTIDPATDSLELTITACMDQSYPPASLTLLVDGALAAGYTPTVSGGVSCLGLPYRATWTPPYPFSVSTSGLQTPHTVEVQFPGGSATSSFLVDTLAPVVDLGCPGCEPSQTTYALADDVCPATADMDVLAIAQVASLELGEPVTLTVTNAGTPVGASPYTTLYTGNPVAFNPPCGVVLALGDNVLTVTTTDQAGNPALPAQLTVTLTP